MCLYSVLKNGDIILVAGEQLNRLPSQRPVFVAIFLPKFRGTAKLQNGKFRGNFAGEIANFAVISRSK